MKTVGIINCESQKTPAIIDYVDHAGYEPEEINWNKANTYDFNKLKRLIISGGPHLFTESPDKHDQLMAKFQFIKTLSTPTLGICLGHQAIAITLGGTAYRGPERRSKDQVTILKKHPLFTGLPDSALFAEDHCEGITPSHQMIPIASSEHYPVEAFVATSKPFIGVQFHPETSGSNGDKIINNFLRWEI